MMQGAIPMQVWVVFTGEADMRILRVLRTGFRHCYILVKDGGRWISVDPMANRLELSLHHHVPEDFDLPAWLHARGQVVVPAYARMAEKAMPISLMTCVEVVKRYLCIRSRRIVTPYQLYKHLMGEERVRKNIIHERGQGEKVGA